MADTPGSSEISSLKTCKKVFLLLNEKNRLSQLTIAAQRQVKTGWAEQSKHQDNIARLQKSHVKVIKTLLRYTKSRRNFEISNPQETETDTFHMLRGIDQERNLVRKQIIQCLKKTRKSIEAIKKFNRSMTAYNESLMEFHERVISTERHVELAQMSVPTLGWMKRMRDPKTKELLADWEKLQLLSRITYLYEQLLHICYPQRLLHFDVHSHDD